MRVLSGVLFVGAILLSATAAGAQDIDWEKVDGPSAERGPCRPTSIATASRAPTSTVTLDGVTIKPALALGGWVAFKPMHGEVMVMGDLVLLETEINPVMAKLIENGLEITAVHNHLLRANPATFYMHVGGHGDPEKIATAIRTALGGKQDAAGSAAGRSAPPPAIDLDTAQLDQIIGVKARQMAASINSPCRAATRSAKTEWLLLRPARWGLRPASASSRQAAARPPSPATSCSLAKRSIR